MRYWENLSRHGDAVALVDAKPGLVLTYAQLAAAVDEAASQLARIPRCLILAPLDNTIPDIIRYLAMLQAGHVPCLYSSQTPVNGLKRLISTYQPALIFGSARFLSDAARHQALNLATGPDSYSQAASQTVLGGRLQLLLSTSGSSGSSKLVRLSAENISANAGQICTALNIGPAERAITSLPLSYIYGLSVLNSHLRAGASIVTETRSIMETGFWNAVSEHGVTSLAGVPWTFQTLKRIGFDQKAYPALRSFTTSGGKIDAQTLAWMNNSLGAVYFMYGMTEAAGRIAVLQPEDRLEAPGSAGSALEGGALSCRPDGSIIYRGPNVMLGYAFAREDLARGDEMRGVLDTNDVGHLDAKGRLFITGRKSRITKLFGLRINLDEVQQFFQERSLDVCVLEGQQDRLILRHCEAAEDMLPHITELKRAFGGLPASAFQLERVSEIRRLESGKMAFGQV